MPEITFYNMWRTNNADDRSALLKHMKDEAPAIAAKPGFVSMTALECGEDGRVLVEGRWQSKEAVYAQWSDEASLTAAISLPEAKGSHYEMAKWGTPEGSLYRVEYVYLPAATNKDRL